MSCTVVSHVEICKHDYPWPFGEDLYHTRTPCGATSITDRCEPVAFGEYSLADWSQSCPWSFGGCTEMLYWHAHPERFYWKVTEQWPWALLPGLVGVITTNSYQPTSRNANQMWCFLLIIVGYYPILTYIKLCFVKCSDQFLWVTFPFVFHLGQEHDERMGPSAGQGRVGKLRYRTASVLATWWSSCWA